MTPDPKFLEMLGHLFLQSARQQQLAETWTAWLAGKGQPTAELTRTLQDLAGPGAAPSGADLAKWQDQFQQAMAAWLELFQVVPAADHRRLASRCRDLEEKCRQQEKTIDRLRRLLMGSGKNQQELVDGFQQIMSDQAQLVQQTLSSFFQPPAPESDDDVT